MVYIVLSVTVWLLDRFTKIWVAKTLPLWSSRPLLGKWLSLTHARNTGAAFGLFSGQAVTLGIFGLACLAALLFWRESIYQLSCWGKLALALTVGGAAGNLFDRLVYGYVIDFLDLGWWPIFNVADCALVVGTGMLIWVLWRSELGGGHRAGV